MTTQSSYQFLQVSVMEYPNYDGGYSYKHREIKETVIQQNPSKAQLRASRLEIGKMNRPTQKADYPNFDGGFDLRNKEVIHELSSGEEEAEEPQPEPVSYYTFSLMSLYCRSMSKQNKNIFIHECTQCRESILYIYTVQVQVIIK